MVGQVVSARVCHVPHLHDMCQVWYVSQLYDMCGLSACRIPPPSPATQHTRIQAHTILTTQGSRSSHKGPDPHTRIQILTQGSRSSHKGPDPHTTIQILTQGSRSSHKDPDPHTGVQVHNTSSPGSRFSHRGPGTRCSPARPAPAPPAKRVCDTWPKCAHTLRRTSQQEGGLNRST